ncbi:nurim homolog [Leptinotarsa decemlineata]|uniref:nurim homolog n=1 Tax=Leptinotarsa decemlineata TaxID=7539 RepID=UPI003D30A1AC
MGFKRNLWNLVKLLLCGFGLISTFYTVIEFTYFLSIPNYTIINESHREVPWEKTSLAMLRNMALLTLFIIQHSLLTSKKIKDAFSAYHLQEIFRSLYVIATSGVLLYLMKHWNSTPNVILWNLNLKYRPIWWMYIGIHGLAWITIYVGNICCDVTELLGLKQVYYSIVNLPDPNVRKSIQLQRLNSHMRHPSFLAFVLIFWLYPIMSLDRIWLASIFTGYMYLGWNPDESDYYYHKYQFDRKHHELEHMKRHEY